MAAIRSFSILFHLIVFCIVSIQPISAEIRTSEIQSDGRSIITFNEFGFTHNGFLDLNVSDIILSVSDSKQDHSVELSKIGFFLSTRDIWFHVLQQLESEDISCALESEFVKKVFSFESLRRKKSKVSFPTSFDHAYHATDAGDFTLVFANCLSEVKVSMKVRSSMYNIDPITKQRDYLSAGNTPLPLIYFLLSIVYAGLCVVWIRILYKKRLTTFRIHYFMLIVIILKALNLICEAEDKSHIKHTGSGHGWDVLFYIFSFLKGITLFTLIVLIGTGWSFLKPHLQDKEKKVLAVVIPLQVVANIAQVIIDESGPYADVWITMKQVFLLVDVVCCCAVLFPIVWSIKKLREAALTDGKAAVNLMKLSLFRHYYIIVVCYIYFTRVVVYGLYTITSYKYMWTSVMAGELATLAFYIFTGYKFRPEVHNPYFLVDDEEEDAAADQVLRDDSFEL